MKNKDDKIIENYNNTINHEHVMIVIFCLFCLLCLIILLNSKNSSSVALCAIM
jgi:hypothetical protein